MKFVLFHSIVLLLVGLTLGDVVTLQNDVQVSGVLSSSYPGEAEYQIAGYEIYVPLNAKQITVSIDFE